MQNYRRGRLAEGGSTITQQLTKVLFLTPDKSLERKMKEAVLALELERRYSKDRILEMYLNQVYFGHGAYGVEAAARTYFGKSVSELNVREAALLAGLPRAPTTYSPFEHGEAAKRRREIVLRRMVDYGALKDADAKRLARSDLGLIPPERRRTTGQYFLEYVQQTLEAKYGADLVFKGGLNVYTTLSPTLQLAAEQALRDGLKALEGRTQKGSRPGEHPEGAIVTIDPATGYVRAMVGGYDFFRSEFNRAVQARRQPGSAFKPFIYIAALESGLTAATRVDDAPVSYAVGPNGQAWKPENYDRKYRGQTTLQQALEESVNVVTVKVQEQRRPQPHDPGRPPLRDHEPARREPQSRARDLRPDADRADERLRGARQPGSVAGAHLDPLRDGRAGQARRGAPAGAARGGVTGDRLSHHPHAARGGRARDRAGGQGPGAADRRQDRDDQRLLERVVHRLHAPRGDRDLGRLRPTAEPREGRDRLARGGADLGQLHGQGSRRQSQGRLRDARSGRPRARRPGSVERVRAGRRVGVRARHRAGGRLRTAAAERPRERCAAGRGPYACRQRLAPSSHRFPTRVAPPVAELPPSSPPPPAAALPNDTLEVPSVSAPVTFGAPAPVPPRQQGP